MKQVGFVYTRSQTQHNVLADEGEKGMGATDRMFSFSCPLDYQIDSDHKNLHPVGQPQANPYSFIDIGAQTDPF